MSEASQRQDVEHPHGAAGAANVISAPGSAGDVVDRWDRRFRIEGDLIDAFKALVSSR